MKQNCFFRNAMLTACAVFVLSSCGKDNTIVGEEDSTVSLKAAAVIEGCNSNGVLVIKNFETGNLSGAVKSFNCEYSRGLKIVGNVPFNREDYTFLQHAYKKLDLSEYTFPNNTVPEEAFSDAAIMVTLPKSIEKIGKRAFANNAGTQEIDLPKVTEIGESAFVYSGLTSVKLPKAKKIGDFAFLSCSSLVTIELKEATTFSRSTFFSTPLKNIFMPSVNNLGVGSFAGAGKGASVELPGIKIVKNSDFSQTGFKQISLPKVIELQSNAFQGSPLKSIELSDCLGKVQFDAFLGLGDITPLTITMKSAPPKVCNGADSRGLVPLSIADGITFLVPANQLSAYQTAPGWAQHANKIIAY